MPLGNSSLYAQIEQEFINAGLTYTSDDIEEEVRRRQAAADAGPWALPKWLVWGGLAVVVFLMWKEGK